MSTRAELLRDIKTKKATLAAIHPVPMEDSDDKWDEYQLAKRILSSALEKFADFEIDEENSTSDTKPNLGGNTSGNFAIDSQIWLQSQLLVTHVSQLGRFNANNNNEVVNFLAKIKSITEACPDIGFSAILNAVKPTMSVTVNKTLANEGKDITTFSQFNKFLKERYAASENIYQKLDAWFSSNKKRGKPFTSHLTELQNNILAIRTGHEEFAKAAKVNSIVKSYEPNDVWELIVFLKLWRDIRGQDSDLYSSLVLEMSQFKKPSQLAARAEVIATQTISTSQSTHVSTVKRNNGSEANAGSSGRSAASNASPNSSPGNSPSKRGGQGNSRGRGRGRGRGHGGGRGGYQNSNGSNDNQSNSNNSAGNQNNRNWNNRANGNNTQAQGRQYSACDDQESYDQQAQTSNEIHDRSEGAYNYANYYNYGQDGTYTAKNW